MTFYNNIPVYNVSYTEVSISTNRLLDFMDFNSYQNIVYSACDILIRLMVEDSDFPIRFNNLVCAVCKSKHNLLVSLWILPI
jgi:hypothetical protein